MHKSWMSSVGPVSDIAIVSTPFVGRQPSHNHSELAEVENNQRRDQTPWPKLIATRQAY
jgi:hypothetical protein